MTKPTMMTIRPSLLSGALAALLAAGGCATDSPESEQIALRGVDGGAQETGSFGWCERVMNFPQGESPDNCLSQMHFGDFETIVDRGHLLLVTNDPSRTDAQHPEQDIVVVEINGVDGRTVNRPQTVVGTNYRGCYGYNGPEWIKGPSDSLDLGIVYSGSAGPGAPRDGVHAVFRQTPTGQFDTELSPTGSLTSVSVDGDLLPTPARLPSSPPLAYPDGSPPDGQPGYAAFMSPACRGKCFGLVTSVPDGGSTMTSMTQWAEDESLTHGASIGHVLDSSGARVLVAACAGSSATTCGLFSTQIDGQGGLVEQQAEAPMHFKPLGPLGGRSTSSALSAGVFPDGTGECAYIFVNEVDGAGPGNDSIHVYRQRAADLSVAQHVATVTQLAGGAGLGAVEHFRATAGRDELVLHYFDRDATDDDRDSFVIRVQNSCDAPRERNLTAEHLTEAGNGTELVWLPRGLAPWTDVASPGAWASYITRPNTQATFPKYEIARCWWNPDGL